MNAGGHKSIQLFRAPFALTAFFIAVYTAITLLLLSRLSLWLDEIIDLLGTQKHSLLAVTEYAASNRGGTPIWYLTQALATRALGFSAFSARLPSCIASIAACWGFALLAKRIGVRWPALYVAAFALLPLQLRYALEGRPYAEALCLSVWATVVFLRLLERTTFLNGFLYFLLIALGLYTQPYLIFVAAAQVIWALANPRVSAKARLFAVGALSVASVSFIPWLVYARHVWPDYPAARMHIAFQFRVFLLVLRECAGGGYLLSLPVVAAILAGVRAGVVRSSTKLLLVLMILLPIGSTLLVDHLFGYFFAIRQVIFILPSMVLLGGDGIEYVASKMGGLVATGLIFLILTTSIVYDVGWFTRPREDWKAATTILRQSVDSGACALLAPDLNPQIFLFFAPDLLHRFSDASNISGCTQIAIVDTPSAAPYSATIARQLTDAGLRQRRVIYAGEPTITLVSRQ